MSSYEKYVNILKSKIPLLPLTLHLAIVKYLYSNCENNDNDYLIVYKVYFSVLFVLTVLLEVYHAYLQYKKFYNNKKEMIIYIIISTLISTSSFLALCYFLENGRPYSCFYSYSKPVAGILFLLVVLLVSVASIIENHYWNKATNFKPKNDLHLTTQL